MRIGIMCHTSLGGSVRIARELALALAQRDHQVHFIIPAVPPGSWDDRHRGIHYHLGAIDPASDRHPASLHAVWSDTELETYTDRVCQIIQSEALEILHFHYAVPFAQIFARVRARLHETCPLLVGTLHGTDVTLLGRDPVIGRQLTSALRALDGLTTVSHCYARLAAEVFALPKLPEVIPNFVDCTRFRSTPIQRIGRDKSRQPKLVHISNFRPVKNTQAIAHIFFALRQKIDAQLWLIGDGPELPMVKEIIDRSDFREDVIFWGVQKDVIPLLSQTNLLLITSHQESFCLAALEAMSCGVPVVATQVGGLPELVRHGVSGFLFPPENPSAAVDAAVTLLTDREQHQATSTAAISQARQYDRSRIIPRYEHFYQSLQQQHHFSEIAET